VEGLSSVKGELNKDSNKEVWAVVRWVGSEVCVEGS
jgi:hypothetical protein